MLTKKEEEIVEKVKKAIPKVMKEWKPSMNTMIIFEAIEHRINEMWNRGMDNNLNPAYEVAVKTGIMVDIEDALKKIKKTKRK